VLSLAKTPDRPVVSPIDDELKAAEPLERHDRTFGYLSCRCRKGLLPRGEHGAPGIPQLDTRTANRARVRLRVEPPVPRVLVFPPALGAHAERLHRRVGSIVGKGLDNAETRPAVRAVRERVAAASVLRVENLGEAVGTRSDIGEDGDVLLPRRVARAYLEAFVARGVEEGLLETLDRRAWWSLVPESR
jgi:hypothetical protein